MVFSIDPASRSPIYQQLGQQIRLAVARGTIQPGERLPSVRQLSRALVVNPNTIARAYLELEREGILISRAGLGFFAAQPRTELTRAARDRRLTELLDRWLTEAVHLGYSAEEVVHFLTQRLRQFHWNADKSKEQRSSHGRCDRHATPH
jgi:GntR family transcriptional regulator